VYRRVGSGEERSSGGRKGPEHYAIAGRERSPSQAEHDVCSDRAFCEADIGSGVGMAFVPLLFRSSHSSRFIWQEAEVGTVVPGHVLQRVGRSS